MNSTSDRHKRPLDKGMSSGLSMFRLDVQLWSIPTIAGPPPRTLRLVHSRLIPISADTVSALLTVEGTGFVPQFGIL